MIPEHRIVPAFNVQVRIITCAEKLMHNLGPVRLAEPRKAMLGHTRVADSIALEQSPIYEGIFGVGCASMLNPMIGK